MTPSNPTRPPDRPRGTPSGPPEASPAGSLAATFPDPVGRGENSSACQCPQQSRQGNHLISVSTAQEFTAANPLSSTPLAARFRCIFTNLRLNRPARGAAITNFRFREFLRRRLLVALACHSARSEAESQNLIGYSISLFMPSMRRIRRPRFPPVSTSCRAARDYARSCASYYACPRPACAQDDARAQNDGSMSKLVRVPIACKFGVVSDLLLYRMRHGPNPRRHFRHPPHWPSVCNGS